LLARSGSENDSLKLVAHFVDGSAHDNSGEDQCGADFYDIELPAGEESVRIELGRRPKMAMNVIASMIHTNLLPGVEKMCERQR